MKILFTNEEEISYFSGCQKQVCMMMKNMSDRGHMVKFSNKSDIDLSNFDVVYVTHVHLPFTLKVCLNCVHHKKKFLVKTLCYPEVYDGYKDQMPNSVHNRNNNKISFVVKHASYLICESEVEKKYVLSQCNGCENKFVLVQPAVNEQFKNEGKPLKKRTLIHCNGNYNHQKGFSHLMDACKELNFPLVMCGKPRNLRDKLIDMIRYNTDSPTDLYGELIDKIDWKASPVCVLGEKNEKELSEIYNETKVYVCASDRELSSTSVCEAIACGCRIVSSSRHIANSNWEKSGYYVFNYNDPTSLRDTLSKAYWSDDLQDNQIWHSQRLTDTYENIFKSMIEPALM